MPGAHRPYIFSKNIIRSDVHTHESNFSNNFNSSDSLTEQVENTESKVPTTKTVEAKVLVSKKKFKSNARKNLQLQSVRLVKLEFINLTNTISLRL